TPAAARTALASSARRRPASGWPRAPEMGLMTTAARSPSAGIVAPSEARRRVARVQILAAPDRAGAGFRSEPVAGGDSPLPCRVAAGLQCREAGPRTRPGGDVGATLVAGPDPRSPGELRGRWRHWTRPPHAVHPEPDDHSADAARPGAAGQLPV